MNAVAEATLEAIAVQQRHEQLEVFFFAVVRRRSHQQEVPRERRQQLAEPVALRVLDLATEERRRELVGLVADDQVPATIRRGELLLQVLVAGQLVQARDDQVVLEEPVSGARGLELVVREDLERELEAGPQFVLPLLREAPGADDEAALQVTAGDQLLHEQAGHDRLAGARIVGQQEAQRLARQHLLVHRRDLVRQRADVRGVDREQWVEQVRQMDALGLGDQAEERPVTVEGPGPAGLDEFKPGLVVPVEQDRTDPAVRCLVGQLQRGRPEPSHRDDGNRAVWEDSPNARVRRQLFKRCHPISL